MAKKKISKPTPAAPRHSEPSPVAPVGTPHRCYACANCLYLQAGVLPALFHSSATQWNAELLAHPCESWDRARLIALYRVIARVDYNCRPRKALDTFVQVHALTAAEQCPHQQASDDFQD